MKRKYLTIVCLSLIGLIMLVPFVNAANSTVFLTEGTKVVWKQISNETDADGNVLDTVTQYNMLNCTDVRSETNGVNVSYQILFNNTEYDSANIDDATKWDENILFSEDEEFIDDNIKTTEWKAYFNEKTLDQTEFGGLNDTEKEGVASWIFSRISPEFFAMYLVYAFAMAFSDPEDMVIHDNTTTAVSLARRMTVLQTNYEFDLYDDDIDVWTNVSMSINGSVIYASNANVLHSASSICHIRSMEGNASEGWTTENIYTTGSWNVVYPTEIQEDLNPDDIPGYSLFFIMASCGIAVALIIKKKKIKA